MHVEKSYVISTRHITPDTLRWIGGQAALTEENEDYIIRFNLHHSDGQIIVYTKGFNGFFIPVYDIQHLKMMEIPEDLMAIIDSIEETGGFWLILDSDAQKTAWLEDYYDQYE